MEYINFSVPWPRDNEVILVAVKLVDGRALWARTGMSTQLFESDEYGSQAGGIVISDLRAVMDMKVREQSKGEDPNG